VYGWIWRKLPFGLWGKLTGSLALIAATGALLWFVVFPWATPLLPFDDVQVGSGTEQGPAQEDPNVISSGDPDENAPDENAPDENAPDEIPYSTESNAPHPSATSKTAIPGD
jgi:cytoskeletal protein RodZ